MPKYVIAIEVSVDRTLNAEVLREVAAEARKVIDDTANLPLDMLVLGASVRSGNAGEVFIRRGVHPTIPGEHFSVHTSKAGASAEALESLNMIRKDLDMPPVSRFTEASVRAAQRVANERGDADTEEGDCDVWIERHEVKP